MKRIVFIFALAAALSEIYAAPASRALRTETLDDGTEISYYVRGDEKYRYFLSTDGYTMLRNEDGVFVYAQKDENDSLIAGNVRAHNEAGRTPTETAFLQTLTPFLTYSEAQVAAFLERWQDTAQPQKARKTGVSSAGSTNPDAQNGRHTRNLVILVNFSDKSFVVSNPQEQFYNLLNEPNYSYNGATGSVRDYFSDNSMGLFQPEFIVTQPVTLPNTLSYYAQSGPRNRQMIIDACNAVNATVDFADFDSDNDGWVDNVCVIFAGNNAAEGDRTLINPHVWTLASAMTYDGKKVYDYLCTSELRGSGKTAASICGIGTFTHEFSHILGLPDMYNDAVLYCLEKWDIMDFGLYNNDGRTPPAYSSYERYFMGWLTPEILNLPANESLEDLKTSNRAFIITNGGTPNFNGFVPSPAEFLLLENRQQTDWDEFLPHHGLLIWRINYYAADWNNNTPNNILRKGIYIIPADGKATIDTQDGDSFPGKLGKTFYAPQWRNNIYLGTSFTYISEESGIISFHYIDGTTTLCSVVNENFKLWTNQKSLHISGVNGEVEIIQTDGRTILKKKVSDFDTEIPIPQAGIYVLKLKNNDKVSTTKFIIH